MPGKPLIPGNVVVVEEVLPERPPADATAACCNLVR